MAIFAIETSEAEDFEKWKKEHDAKVRADAIEECISKIDTLEQISFGIVEVDLIRSLLEQLKEQK